MIALVNEDDIARVAEAQGCKASVSHYADYDPSGPRGEKVRWCVLSVDRGDGWEVLGRQRSRSELLDILRTRTAPHDYRQWSAK